MPTISIPIFSDPAYGDPYMNNKPQAAFFGGLLLDRYLELDRFPVRGGDAVIQKEYEFVGGCAINMAAAFKNLGGEAHLVAELGPGPVGRRIGSYLDEHGFSRRFIAPGENDNGYCFVFLEPDGERTFMTRDSLGRYPRALVEETWQDISCAAVTGYYLLDEPEAVSRSLTEFAAKGGLLLYDPGPLLDKLDARAHRRAINAARIVTMNESEAAVYGLPDAKDTIVVIKNGADGGRVYHNNQHFDYPAAPAALVDGTGAGDAFAGALLYALAVKMPLKQAVELAARAAAKTVALQGPHGFWKPEEL